MDARQKLESLADAAKYDASCVSSGGRREASKEGHLERARRHLTDTYRLGVDIPLAKLFQ